MTFEQQVEGALHAVDQYVPSPDLFAKVRRSITEDLAHRNRVRKVLLRVGAALAAVLAYLALAIDVVDGVWTMSYTALELLVTAVMISIVVVMGPAIRRFGETFEQAVFGSVPETGTHVLRLLDVAYYLIFGAFIMMTTTYDPPLDLGNELAGWVEWVQFRLGGLLLLMGTLHATLVLALPVVGLVHAANRRRIRLAHGTTSSDRSLDKVDSAITVITWVLAALVALLLLPMLMGLIVGGGGGEG